ncbi:MAG: hypothetical protein ACUVT7_01655 [Thermoplasmata archaeon]
MFPLLQNSLEDVRADSLPVWTRLFHLHDGAVLEAGAYDWANSSGPANPSNSDYDSDGLPGITIKRNVPATPPPQRSHHWYLYPAVGSDVVLTGNLIVHVWAKSRDNESGTLVKATFSDMSPGQFSNPGGWNPIASNSSSLNGPVYSEFQMVNVTVPIPSGSYALLQGHFLVLTISRGDSINDWLLVWFDRTDYDSFIEVTTNSFVSVDSAWTQDMGGLPREIFSEEEQIVVTANVSDPFGAYDIVCAKVSVRYESNGTIVRDAASMTLLANDTADPPYWKLFRHTLANLRPGLYMLNTTANDTQGSPTWLNIPLTIVTVDHFGISTPSSIVAGQPFNMTVTALDASNGIVLNWVGTVQLGAFKQDRITPGDGALSMTTVTFTLGDAGRVNVTDQTYDYGEESIYIRATSGLHDGWSGLITVKSGPVVSIWISPRPGTLTAGSSIRLTATGNDSLSNVNNSWTPVWTIAEGSGDLIGSGLSVTFVGNTTGLVNVTCSNPTTGAVDFLLVQIVPGALARIEISASSVPLVIHEGQSEILTAMGYDAHDNIVDLAGATWDTNTSGTVTGSGPSAVYTAGFIPETGAINVRLSGVVGTLEVEVLNSLYGPWLITIPAQIRNEDSGSWDLSLSGYWQDINGTSSLAWWVEEVNTSLYFISHDSSSNALMHFYTQPDQFGEDNFTLWVIDPDGFRTFQSITVRILPVNDKPQFVNNPPTTLYVKFDTPYTFDYSYYVMDIDNAKTELSLSSSMQANVYFDGLIGTFMFSPRIGESSYFEFVTLTLSDSIDSSALVIIVKVTDDSPPSLNMSLPDVTVYEGVVDYLAFDLDLYFFDLDSDYLVYSSGFKNIVVWINDMTHEVFISTPYEWSGTTEGTFTATDPMGALKVDTILVTVIAVNDPPSIDYIPTVHVRYNVTHYLYLSSCVSDPDNSLDSLTFDFSDPHVKHTRSPSGAHRLELMFPCNLTGSTYTEPYMVNVRMNVSDPEKAYALRDFKVLVTDNTPPMVVAPNPDQLYYSFAEDGYLNNSLRLADLFFDPDDASLSYFISGWTNVHPILHPSGVVNLTAATNWSGSEVLTVTAVDSKGGWALLTAHVTVTEVNDAPWIHQIPDVIVKGGQRNLKISILIYFYDSDDAFANLTISPIQTSGVMVVGDELYVSLPDGVDVIPVTLEASDGELTSNRVTFKVGVSKTLAEKIGWPYSFPLVLLAAGVSAYFLSAKIPRPFALENLFLIHNDGRLVTHVTKEENTTLDKDVVSAMFTAVQEFVRDSFQKGEVGLKKLEIGDKNVIIEKGQSAYLALIYSGWPPKEVFDVLPMLMRDIEERYRGRLERWNGTMKSLRGVEKMLQDFMADSYKPGTWPQEEELAEEEWVDILSKEG